MKFRANANASTICNSPNHLTIQINTFRHFVAIRPSTEVRREWLSSNISMISAEKMCSTLRSRRTVSVFLPKTSYQSSRLTSALSSENRIQTIGAAINSPTIPTHSISSPFFPNYYPSDLFLEHVLKCNTTVSSDCRIEIVFIDFQVFYSSSMQV